MAKPKRIKRPKYIWVLYGPDGEPRDSFFKEPSLPDVFGKWYAAEFLDTPGSWESPRDDLAGKKAGFRVRKYALSAASNGGAEP